MTGAEVIASGAKLGDEPSHATLLLDLFTEIAILEHLVRERMEPIVDGELTAQQFGVINYFVRQRKASEKLTMLAWCFQIEEPEMLVAVEGLAAKRLVEIDWVEGDRCVFLTPAGQARHDRFMADAAPEILDIMSEFDVAALQVTADTLKEIRRTFDNLPDR